MGLALLGGNNGGGSAFSLKYLYSSTTMTKTKKGLALLGGNNVGSAFSLKYLYSSNSGNHLIEIKKIKPSKNMFGLTLTFNIHIIWISGTHYIFGPSFDYWPISSCLISWCLFCTIYLTTVTKLYLWVNNKFDFEISTCFS